MEEENVLVRYALGEEDVQEGPVGGCGRWIGEWR